uniref:CAAX prenyl protease 2/Lysostaphin resistance protein A-like domain-containing protein n=1 Tax=Craspedostauros australis TaxID=1486917 RepID=A0A7R9ZN51_9STRA|mmetsp:Transcript_20300/g.56548  ORF Transcript_20300/g.56548 Transcript_20300/m.56548 type:complete len:143 (+) Transcript_20300:3-431(+)
MATQRSVMAVLGTRWKPRTALLASTALGMAAGFGEEMLFRGVLQYELGASFAAVGWTSVLFGLLHAVTPLYAVLATLASLYFGWLYLAADNLVVPILTHGLYDVAALMYAHYTVSKLSPQEQLEIAEWRGPGDPEEKEEKSS